MKKILLFLLAFILGAGLFIIDGHVVAKQGFIENSLVFPNAKFGGNQSSNVATRVLNALVYLTSVDTDFGAITPVTDLIGAFAERAADASNDGVGLYGYGKTSAAKSGIGVKGYGGVDNSNNASDAVGMYGWAISTHVGGKNIGYYADARNGLTNYSFYGANGDFYNNGNVVFTGKFIQTPTSTTLLATTTVPTANSKLRVTGSGGAVTLTNTPTLTAGTSDGQEICISGESDSNTVTLQDNGTLVGSALKLDADTNITLGLDDVICLEWVDARSIWRELHRSFN